MLTREAIGFSSRGFERPASGKGEVWEKSGPVGEGSKSHRVGIDDNDPFS